MVAGSHGLIARRTMHTMMAVLSGVISGAICLGYCVFGQARRAF